MLTHTKKNLASQMIQSTGELIPDFLSFSTMIQEQLTPLEQAQLEIAELTTEYKEYKAKLKVLLDKPDRTETEERTMAGLITLVDNLGKKELVLLKRGNTLTIVRKQF
jgi:phage shock protein A